MKKLLTLGLTALIMTACSSNHVASNSHSESERQVASINQPDCHIEQHSRNKSWFRLSVNGEPHNEHWYGQKQVLRIKNNYVQKGKCQ